jgi:tRNA (guanine37-N1)-methyltransferase
MVTLKQALWKKLSKKERDHFTTAFDIVGDIIIIEIKKELKKKVKLIGKTLLSMHSNVNVVCMKQGGHIGKFRTQKLKVIAGEKRKETTYIEHGVRLDLDVENCYFSPRLSTERKRIYSQIKKGEKVMVMFSGVGPYPIVISKNTLAKEAYGIEANPIAHKYAEINVKKNKVGNVILFKGDVRKVIPEIKMKFDRIVMPLPKGAEKYLDVALKIAKKGTIMHIYCFEHADKIEEGVKSIEKEFKKAKRRFKLIRTVRCGQQGPRIYRICVDVKVIK